MSVYLFVPGILPKYAIWGEETTFNIIRIDTVAPIITPCKIPKNNTLNKADIATIKSARFVLNNRLNSCKSTNPLIATRIMEKNQLLNNLVNAQEEFDVIPGMKKLIPEKTKILVDIKWKLVERTVQKLPSIPDNFSTINLFRNGIKDKFFN